MLADADAALKMSCLQLLSKPAKFLFSNAVNPLSMRSVQSEFVLLHVVTCSKVPLIEELFRNSCDAWLTALRFPVQFVCSNQYRFLGSNQ